MLYELLWESDHGDSLQVHSMHCMPDPCCINYVIDSLHGHPQ